ncbi:MAG: hypothetical protein WAS21_10485 [Geminicoccaceae bacterium]
MSQYQFRNRTVCAKVETTEGVDAAPTVGSNAVLTENPNSNLRLNTIETNESTGALDKRAPIPTSGNQQFSAKVYLHGSGSPGVVLPEVDPFLKACGFAPTAFAADVTGTAQAGASGSITLASGSSASNNFYRGCVIQTTGGTGAGQTRLIRTYVGSTKVAGVTPAWDVAPDATTTYAIKACHIYKQVSAGLPSITIYEYLHRRDGGLSKLRRHLGAAGTFRFVTQVSEGCYFEFQMTGSLEEPDDVTYPGAATYQSTRPIPFINLTACALGGTSIALRNFSFDAGNQVSQTQDPRKQFGLGVAGVTERGAGGTFQAPMELKSVRNAFTSWRDGIETHVAAIWGSVAGNRFAMLPDHMIYTGAADADAEGFVNEDLPFRSNLENDSMMITYW